MSHEKLTGMGVGALRAGSFGERLRQVREERLPGEVGRGAMARRLRARGLEDDADAYSEIESGNELPRDAGRFFDIVTEALGLHGTQCEALLQQLAFDILRAEAGESVAFSVFGAIRG